LIFASLQRSISPRQMSALIVSGFLVDASAEIDRLETRTVTLAHLREFLKRPTRRRQSVALVPEILKGRTDEYVESAGSRRHWHWSERIHDASFPKLSYSLSIWQAAMSRSAKEGW
jgi:hypothetical protein